MTSLLQSGSGSGSVKEDGDFAFILFNTEAGKGDAMQNNNNFEKKKNEEDEEEEDGDEDDDEDDNEDD